MVLSFYKILLVWVITLHIGEVHADKRLVLHSDQDIIQKLGSLEQDIQGMKTEMQGMKTELVAKDQAIATLNQTLDQKSATLAALEQNQQAIVARLTNKDKEIATLNQTLDQKSASLAALEQTLQGVQTELTAKTLEISTLQQSISLKANAAAMGSTFVRWGRTTCGNSSHIVYKGFAAGPYFGEPGNGANMLCLPEHPTWAQFDSSNTGGRIYGAEYAPYFSPLNLQHFEDMPCSVCKTHLSTTIMQPASTQCSAGWTMQYTGYLMSSHYNQAHPTDYICVDGHPEALYHGESDQQSPDLYVVQAKCGSLPCQVYPDGHQLACSVCSA